MILESKRRVFGGSGGGGSISPKKKRPLGGRKMSSKGGSIGIGTIIFWGFIAYSIFGGGDDDADKKPKDTTSKPSIEEKVEKITIKFGDTVADLIEVGEEKVLAKSQKKEKKVVAENTTTEKPKNHTTEKAKNDPYESDDDLYGSTDDKW